MRSALDVCILVDLNRHAEVGLTGVITARLETPHELGSNPSRASTLLPSDPTKLKPGL